MSDFYVDIVDRPIYYLSIDTSIDTSFDHIEIQKFNDYHLEIINTEKVLANDLPDDIPMSKIIGNLSINRIDFEDPYGVGYVGLNSYLNTYEFDCGTP